MKAHCLSLSHYHLWAFQKLYAALQKVSDDDYRADMGLFFRSVHGTLNHLLLADRVWHARFAGTAAPAARALDEELVVDRAALEAATYAQCRAWREVIAGHPADAFGETLTYHNMAGVPCRTPFGKTLLHVFNHGTHHRGQISGVISRLGFPVPEMDYIYYIREAE